MSKKRRSAEQKTRLLEQATKDYARFLNAQIKLAEALASCDTNEEPQLDVTAEYYAAYENLLLNYLADVDVSKRDIGAKDL
jgi:hypothetical protein